MLRFDEFFFLSILGGIAISIGFLLLFCVMVMTRKYIDDMFHSLRTHVCLTWILAMVMHIVTGNIGDTLGDNFKVDFWDNFKINPWVNFKVYFCGQLGTFAILEQWLCILSQVILGTCLGIILI